MKKYLTGVVAVLLLSLALSGCASQAEVPATPSDAVSANSSTYTLTDGEQLKSLAIGQPAVWRDYEVMIKSIDRNDDQLTAHIEVTSHGKAQDFSVENLMSFGMYPLSSSFSNDSISVSAGETVAGSLTFEDKYESQRLFWNDGEMEAFWLLDLTPIQTEQEIPAATEKKTSTPDTENDAQKTAIAALEAEIPSLLTNNTPQYEFAGVTSSTATVVPHEGGGYEYTNDISILDGSGSAATAHVRLICEANGNCISMTINDIFLF